MHYTNRKFWSFYDKLPSEAQKIADNAYKLLKTDPNHPSLHLKKVGQYWYVRVGISYRALGIEVKGGILWFWIGTHAQYDNLIKL